MNSTINDPSCCTDVSGSMTERIFFYAKFHLNALLSLAESLRGRPCACDASKQPKAGSLNWAIFICFDDGIEWVFRSPRSGHDAIVGDESASKMLISEAATLKYLRANSSVPIPVVYAYRYQLILSLPFP